MNYTWKVVGLVKKNEPNHPNTIVNVRWQKIGTDAEGNIGFFEGATPFILDPSSQNFIAYEDLTEQVLLDWVKPKVVNDYEAHVNGRIQHMIDQELLESGTVEESDLPWGAS